MTAKYNLAAYNIEATGVWSKQETKTSLSLTFGEHHG